MAKQAKEIIAFVTGQDYDDMEDMRYQSTRTSIPVYTIGNEYFCCPTARQKLPKGEYDWKPYSKAYERQVYVSK
jgi:hypothetical protein